MAKSESEAVSLFREKLFRAVSGDNIIYVIADQEHVKLLPDGAVRILVTADLETIKERFTARMHGNLPAPVDLMLDEHGLKDARLYCLNKYGRNFFLKNSNSTLELEDYYRMKFDYAVEDSPKAFRFFEHLPELKVLVFDRPWNRACAFPNGNYQRCADWESIRRIVAGA